MSGRHLAFPFRIGTDGRSVAPANLDEHVRGEILQLLLTNAGERPFLPSLGGNLRRLVFQGNDEVTLLMKSLSAMSQSLPASGGNTPGIP